MRNDDALNYVPIIEQPTELLRLKVTDRLRSCVNCWWPQGTCNRIIETPRGDSGCFLVRWSSIGGHPITDGVEVLHADPVIVLIDLEVPDRRHVTLFSDGPPIQAENPDAMRTVVRIVDRVYHAQRAEVEWIDGTVINAWLCWWAD